METQVLKIGENIVITQGDNEITAKVLGWSVGYGPFSDTTQLIINLYEIRKKISEPSHDCLVQDIVGQLWKYSDTSSKWYPLRGEDLDIKCDWNELSLTHYKTYRPDDV